jgi:subtilisin family serine protease
MFEENPKTEFEEIAFALPARLGLSHSNSSPGGLVMRSGRCVQFAVSVVFAAAVLLAQNLPTDVYQGATVAANEVLVKVGPLSSALGSALSQSFAADRVQGIGSNGWVRVHSPTKNVAALMSQAAVTAGVIRFEPNYIVTVASSPKIPDDPDWSQLWALPQISASLAWNYSTGYHGTVVGVVDTGVDLSHPDLVQNLWSAPAAYAVTVGSTQINCPAGAQGFNAILMTCIGAGAAFDDNGHGTHVSGTIGAVGNNGIGVVGVNWTASIMGLKFIAANGEGAISDAVNAIAFAVQTKAYFADTTTPVNVRALSNSWGGGVYTLSLLDEINTAAVDGMLFVAAAGNYTWDLDTTPFYPASYETVNEIAVAATSDTNDDLASFSDYGPNTVELAAPGVNILSTWLPSATCLANSLQNQLYCVDQGTSMATPHVSGTALLMLSRCSLATAGLKSMILNTVDPVQSLHGVVGTGGRLDANSAIHACAAKRPFPAETDANGDSYGDLFVYDPSGGNEYTLFSTGNGSFATITGGQAFTESVSFNPGYNTLLRGDFNGDHMADLYAYNSATGLSAVGLSNSSGGMAVTTNYISPGYNFIEAGDFNFDGMTDIVLYNSSTGTMEVGLSNGSGGFNYVYTLVSAGFTSVVVGDFNGDGYADIALYNKNTAVGYLGLGNGDGTFNFSSLFLGPSYDHVLSGDFNGDGKSDLIIYNSASGTLYAGVYPFAGNNWSYSLVSSGFTTVALADFNGDGLGDLLLYNSNNSAGYLGIGNGTGANFNFNPVSFGSGYDTISIQDFNGDGMQDVLIFNSSTGTAYAGISTGTNFNYTYNLFGVPRLIAR